MKLEVDLEPVPFTKRVSHPPFARGGYNSEEWVFDDEDDDDLPAEQSDFGGEEEQRHHHAAGIPDDGIRSLEVSFLLQLLLFSSVLQTLTLTVYYLLVWAPHRVQQVFKMTS